MTYIRGRNIPTSWYVSKIGSDSDVGNNKDRPFLTIGKALSECDENDAIIVLDSESYTENITVSNRVKLDARYATLIGQVSIGTCSEVILNKHFASESNQVLIRNLGCTERSTYTACVVSCLGGGVPTIPYTGTRLIRNEIDLATIKINIKAIYQAENGVIISPVTIPVAGGGDIVNKSILFDNWTWVNPDVTPSLSNRPGNVNESETETRFAEWHFSGVPDLETQNRCLIYDFGVDTIISFYDFYQRFGARAPKGWKLYGSADLITEVLIGTVIGETAWASPERRTYNIPAPVAYRYYRFRFTDGNQLDRVRLNTVRMFEEEAIGSEESYGGKVVFDIEDLLLGSNGVGIDAKSADCDYQGSIKKVSLRPLASSATFIKASAGFISVKGNSCDITDNTFYNISGGEIDFDYLTIKGLYIRTGGTIVRGTRTFDGIGTPDNTYDGVDTASIGLFFKVGDMVNDGTNLLVCTDNTTNTAVWVSII